MIMFQTVWVFGPYAYGLGRMRTFFKILIRSDRTRMVWLILRSIHKISTKDEWEYTIQCLVYFTNPWKTFWEVHKWPVERQHLCPYSIYLILSSGSSNFPDAIPEGLLPGPTCSILCCYFVLILNVLLSSHQSAITYACH